MSVQINKYRIYAELDGERIIVTVLFDVDQLRDLIPESFKSLLPICSLFTDLSALAFNTDNIKLEFTKFVFDIVLKLHPDLYTHAFEYNGGSTIIIHL